MLLRFLMVAKKRDEANLGEICAFPQISGMIPNKGRFLVTPLTNSHDLFRKLLGRLLDNVAA